MKIKVGDKVRYKIENEKLIDQKSLKYLSDEFKYKNVYPHSYKSGEWFVVDRVSGEYFDFAGSNRIGIIPYTLRNFPIYNWEWEIKSV